MSEKETAYSAIDIHRDKWIESECDWEVLDVFKNYFLKRVKTKQDVELTNQISEKDQI